MESPKRGCDLGPCVLKRWRSKKALRLFFAIQDFPRGQGLRSGPLFSKSAAFCVCVLKPTKVSRAKGSSVVRGFFRHRPPGQHPRCRFDIDSTSISRCELISMPNRPVRRGGRGGFEGRVQRGCG